MLSYLRYFSTSFIIAVILWPFISFVLTLPILAGMYHRYHRLRVAAVLCAYLGVLYMLGLAAFALYPMPDNPAAFCAGHHLAPQLDPLAFIDDIHNSGAIGFLQLAFNVIFFMPLGFILVRWMHWKVWGAFAASIAVSTLIEFTQLTGFWGFYPCPYRQFDVNDLMTNALGALAGTGVALMLGRLMPVRVAEDTGVNTQPGLLHRAVCFALDMLFVTLAYMPVGLALVFAVHALAKPLPNGDFSVFGITVGVAVTNITIAVLMALAFLVFEVWIPVTHQGQTLGAMFTHMSVETRQRNTYGRLAFYVVRTLVLYSLVGVGFDLPSLYRPVLVFGLLVFWIIWHAMPYDFIGGTLRVGPDPAEQHEQSSQTEDVSRAVQGTGTEVQEAKPEAIPAQPIQQTRSHHDRRV